MLEQWEEDDEPLPADELPEGHPNRPEPKLDLSKFVHILSFRAIRHLFYCGLRQVCLMKGSFVLLSSKYLLGILYRREFVYQK